MKGATGFERERVALESLLASGILRRAPNLAQLLTYVCQKHFEGEADRIKEYNIAVEALGRPPEFDQKRDSIVRVEAYRLRKRLRRYYDSEGAGQAMRIEIPPGQYAPRFISQGPLQGVSTSLSEFGKSPTLEFALVKPWRRTAAWVFASVLVLILIGIPVFRVRRSAAAAVHPLTEPVVAESGRTIRILAGSTSGAYRDGFDHVWGPDRFFLGGAAIHLDGHPIAETYDPRIYESRREGAFAYKIRLAHGVYELRLYFAETLYGYMNLAGGGETTRLFNVAINGRDALRYFDVIGEAGPSAAHIKVFRDVSPEKDGYLHLDFKPVNSGAFLNGIELTPGIAGGMLPVRMIAADRGLSDGKGMYWQPDHYSRGGQLVRRNESISGTASPELYRSERFGNITYTVPVANGTYGVTLHFAEYWFGPGKAAGGGTGSRVFNILCNGVMLARNFDLYREAGGSNRALIKTFHGLEPNPQGTLVISLVPVQNYACINALEVLDESQISK